MISAQLEAVDGRRRPGGEAHEPRPEETPDLVVDRAVRPLALGADRPYVPAQPRRRALDGQAVERHDLKRVAADPDGAIADAPQIVEGAGLRRAVGDLTDHAVAAERFGLHSSVHARRAHVVGCARESGAAKRGRYVALRLAGEYASLCGASMSITLLGEQRLVSFFATASSGRGGGYNSTHTLLIQAHTLATATGTGSGHLDSNSKLGLHLSGQAEY